MSLDPYSLPDRKPRARWFGFWDNLVNRFLEHYAPARLDTAPGHIAVDPHIHSLFSVCSISSPERIILRAVKMGLSAIAILDHNDPQGRKHAEMCAQQLKQQKAIPEDFLVIPGVEISTADGHIGALFIDEPVETGLSPSEAVQRIHEAGGLAVAVHPYTRSGIGDALFDAPFDAVEIESGSAFGRFSVERAHDLLADPRLKNVAKLGSSDAHYVGAVGSCYTVVDTDRVTLESVRSAIEDGRCSARSSDMCLRLRRLLGGIAAREPQQR